MVAAGVATAGWIERPVVLGVAGILDVDPSLAGEELPVARVARWHHTVEHVDAAGDRLDEVLGSASAHQIPRPIHGQLTGRLLRDGVHHLDRLANAEPADRVTLEPCLDGSRSALVAQILKNAALHDPELRLAGI